jgi:hypothetical protein
MLEGNKEFEMVNTDKYKEKYRSIQLNVDKEKYADLLEWLEYRAENEERSFNYLIIKALLEVFKGDVKKENM